MTSYSITGTFEETVGQGTVLDFSKITREPVIRNQRALKKVRSFEGFIGQLYMEEAGLLGEGYIEDIYGVAAITDFVLDESTSQLSFTKQYPGKAWLLYYMFHQEGESWNGTWESGDKKQGIILATGVAMCQLVKLSPRSTK
jgi:hypothetical protein